MKWSKIIFLFSQCLIALVLVLSLIVAGLVLANGTAAINKWGFGGGGGIGSWRCATLGGGGSLQFHGGAVAQPE